MRWMAYIPALALLPHAHGETAVEKKVSYSSMSVLLGDKAFVNRRIELILHSGAVAEGSLRGFEGGAVLLKGKPAVPICEVQIVRISHNSAGKLRRSFAIAGGVMAGMMLGGPLAFALGDSGAWTAALATYLAFPIAGGWAGAVLAAKRETTSYVLEHEAPSHLCSAP